jgi:hypothetical protein
MTPALSIPTLGLFEHLAEVRQGFDFEHGFLAILAHLEGGKS